MASLTVVSGPNEGDYYPLSKRTIVVGRQENCPIQITDERASRKHLQIRFENDQHHALDMQSENGVWVNGRKIENEITLVDGDEIQIGHSTIVYSTMDFADRESAFEHYKQRGQRSMPTIPEA